MAVIAPTLSPGWLGNRVQRAFQPSRQDEH
jgi:hypothetical protein